MSMAYNVRVLDSDREDPDSIALDPTKIEVTLILFENAIFKQLGRVSRNPGPVFSSVYIHKSKFTLSDTTKYIYFLCGVTLTKLCKFSQECISAECNFLNI